MALAQESISRTPDSCYTQLNCNTHCSARTSYSFTPHLPRVRGSLWLSNYYQSRKPSIYCLTSGPITREPGYCYYHAKFGPSARNCQTLCLRNQTASCPPEFLSPRSRSTGTVNPLSDDDGPFPTDLLFVRDPLNNLNFMMDNSRSRSLLPSNLPPRPNQSQRKNVCRKWIRSHTFRNCLLDHIPGSGTQPPLTVYKS